MSENKITSDKDYIYYSEGKERIENTVTLTVDLKDAKTAKRKVQNVIISFYSNFSRKQDCEQIQLIFVKDPKAETETMEADPKGNADIILKKKILIKAETAPCKFEIIMKKVVTILKDPGRIDVTVNLTGGLAVQKTLKFEKHSKTPELLDFYPNHGSALAGAEVYLNWETSGNGTVKLEADKKEIPISSKVKRQKVTVSKTTEYTLTLFQDQQQVDQRRTKIQVLPVYLKTFCLDEDRKNVIWEVCCAEKVTLNHHVVSAEEIQNETPVRGSKTVLEASGCGDRVISTLYCGRDPEKEERDIRLFRKTLSLRNGVWLLKAEWQKLAYNGPGLHIAKTLSLEWRDTKTGVREVFYRSEGEDVSPHSWEMLIEGHDSQMDSQDVEVIMNVVPMEGAAYAITL